MSIFQVAKFVGAAAGAARATPIAIRSAQQAYSLYKNAWMVSRSGSAHVAVRQDFSVRTAANQALKSAMKTNPELTGRAVAAIRSVSAARTSRTPETMKAATDSLLHLAEGVGDYGRRQAQYYVRSQQSAAKAVLGRTLTKVNAIHATDRARRATDAKKLMADRRALDARIARVRQGDPTGIINAPPGSFRDRYLTSAAEVMSRKRAALDQRIRNEAAGIYIADSLSRSMRGAFRALGARELTPLAIRARDQIARERIETARRAREVMPTWRRELLASFGLPS